VLPLLLLLLFAQVWIFGYMSDSCNHKHCTYSLLLLLLLLLLLPCVGVDPWLHE
jgi:hypothetical protein